MILYDPASQFNLSDFGISIPIFDTRASKTFAHLKNHPILGPLATQWHRRPGPESLDREDLLRVHDADYVNRLFSDDVAQELIKIYELVDDAGRYHRYDPAAARLPLAELFKLILARAAGSLQCCRVALQSGFCFNFGGGMHHAQSDHGKGFCPVNDIVIAIRRLQAEKLIRTAWVIDVDAHKGDGTAALTRGDGTITTLSIHMGAGWPMDEPPVAADGTPNPSFVPSDIDVPIFPGEEAQYLPRLAAALEALDAAGRPDLAVVVSGADPYEKDALPSTGGLRLSLDQMMDRDQMVYTFLRKRRHPSAYLMAGGYGHEVWRVYAQFLEWALLGIYG